MINVECSDQELMEVLTALKNNSSPEPDNIPCELIKILPQN